MIKLWENLPNAVEANGRFIYLNTDFKYWLLFDNLLQKDDTRFCDLDFVLKDEIMDEDILKACIGFLLNKNSTPNCSGSSDHITDFEEDGEFIFSAFMEKYNIDLLETNMHWHKFLALYRGLLNSYSDIVGYRAYKGEDKEFLRIKHEWALPKKTDKSERKRQVLSILLGDGDFTKGG